MGKAVAITDTTFDKIISENKLVLVDFWAEWCGPCRMVGPIVDELAEEYDGSVFIGKVDVDSNPESSSKYGIRSIPTLLFFKKGEVIDKQIGAADKKTLSDKISEHIN